MSVDFPAEEILNFERAMQVGATAEEIMSSKQWQWIHEKILGALQDQAINSLKNARSEEDRVKAQQQFLAAHKPKEILEALISAGRAAKAQIDQISTQEGENGTS